MRLVKEEKSWLEWLVFASSVVLIALVVIYLVMDGVQDQSRPPDIRVTLGTAQSSAHGFLVPLSVTNQGDQTAQTVELEVRSGDGDKEQTATLSYDFLASGEVRKGWVGFYGPPDSKLAVRVVGYRTD